MTSDVDPAAAAAREEYNTLRDETLKRVEFRNQISTYTLTFAAGMFTLGLGRDAYREALLVYPIIAFFFSVSFAYNSLMLIEIGAYIRTLEGVSLGRSGWAAHLKDRYSLIEPFEVVATSGLFLGTQALAIGLFLRGVPQAQPRSPLDSVLVSVSVAAFVLTVLSIVYPVIYHRLALRRHRAPASSAPVDTTHSPAGPPA
jgi:hypothetical protein